MKAYKGGECARVNQRHFGGKNAIAVIILLWVQWKCRSGGNNLSNAKSFIILRSEEDGESFTSFNKNNRVNFSGEKRKMKLFMVPSSWEYEN